MSTLEIIGGVVLLITCLVIVILCLSQETKDQNGMNALTGSSTDSFYGKNEGRSREAILARLTRTAGIILFIATLAVNIIPIFTKK